MIIKKEIHENKYAIRIAPVASVVLILSDFMEGWNPPQ
jgi:hypothetical protein